MGITATGDVTTGSIDRNEALARYQSGRKLGLELGQTGQLVLGESPNPIICELNVISRPLRQPRPCRIDNLTRYNNVTRQVIQGPWVMPRSLLATGFYFSLHGIVSIFLPSYGGLGSFLQIFNMGILLIVYPAPGEFSATLAVIH